MGRVNRLRDHALETELPGVLQDKLAVAGVVAVELKAELAFYDRLKECLAFDEGKSRDVAAVEVQDIERVIGEPCSAFAVRCGLGMSEARQSRFVNATQFAVEIGGLHV
jgi:hypothetical protein